MVGASLAGLGAARILSNHFERVTIVERDALPAEPVSRKGVPQGNHTHGLLPSGYRVLEDYFPGIIAELVARGACHGDVTGDFIWYHSDSWKLRTAIGLPMVSASRPCLEWHVRERVVALPGVTLLDQHDCIEPVYDFKAQRVGGVSVRDRASSNESVIDADLVVDTSGRGSHAPEWLARWGYRPPAETSIRVDVGYATALFERRSGDFSGSFGSIIAGTAPRSKRYAAIMGIEGKRWIITLAGCQQDYPPTELGAWRQYARGLPTPDVAELVTGREPLGAIMSHRFPSNRRRHFELLRDFPDGFLVLGDAICSFNPIYGQGMSVALNEAHALDQCLVAGTSHLAQRFFERSRCFVDTAWTIVMGEDFRYPSVEGRRPFGFALSRWYLDHVHQAATVDKRVLAAFFQVAGLLASPSHLLQPAIVWRALRSRAPALIGAQSLPVAALQAARRDESPSLSERV